MNQLLSLIREHCKTYCRSVQLSYTADNSTATQLCGTSHSDGGTLGTLIPAQALLLISFIRLGIIFFWIVYKSTITRSHSFLTANSAPVFSTVLTMNALHWIILFIHAASKTLISYDLMASCCPAAILSQSLISLNTQHIDGSMFCQQQLYLSRECAATVGFLMRYNITLLTTIRIVLYLENSAHTIW